DGRRQRVRGHVQKNQIDIALAELMPGFKRFHRTVDQAEVDDLNAGPLQSLLNDRDISLQPLFQPRELRPVGVQPDSEQADFQWTHIASLHSSRWVAKKW